MTPACSKIVWCFSLLCVASVIHAQELPAKTGKDDLATDANKLIDGLPALANPGTLTSDGAVITVQQAKARLEQAQKKLQRWEKLLKQGVLSKAEVEHCTIEVAEDLAGYEHANVLELQRQLTASQQRPAGAAPDSALVEAAMQSLKSAQEAAAKADVQLLQTKLDLAKINLERQHKLYEMKMISQASLQEAEAQVQKIADQKALQEQARVQAQTAAGGPAITPAADSPKPDSPK